MEPTSRSRTARSRPSREGDGLVSGAVPPSTNSDVEIDLGRWAQRVLSRWYIVLACVVLAIIIAMLGEGQGHREWTARALVNQGLPYTSTNQPILQSLGTNTSAA